MEDIDDVAGHDENPVAKQCADVLAQHSASIAAGTAAGYDMSGLGNVKQPKKKKQNIDRVTSGELGDIVEAIKNCPQRLSAGVLQLMMGTKAMNSRDVMLGMLDRYHAKAKAHRDSVAAAQKAANVALCACQELEASFLPEGLDQEKVGKLSGTQLKVLLRCRHGAGMSISLQSI